MTGRFRTTNVQGGGGGGGGGTVTSVNGDAGPAVVLDLADIGVRVVALADATAITPTAGTADLNTHPNTQAAGAFTVNAPSGSPFEGQKLQIRIKSTNVQTFAWNAIFRGSTSVPLPASTTGTSRTDYLLFQYNSADTKWDLAAANYGFI